jgi:hypothetical protein
VFEIKDVNAFHPVDNMVVRPAHAPEIAGQAVPFHQLPMAGPTKVPIAEPT